MRLVALAVVCGLIVGQDGGSDAAAAPGFEPAPRTRATGSLLSMVRRGGASAATAAATAAAAADFLLEQEPGSSLCFSLRENDERRQLLCNDRRSKFNVNPFGLRFGKRLVYRRAFSRTDKLSPLYVVARELEVPT